MEKDNQIIIAGAGPTGLSAALFLSEHGIIPRIFEKHTAPQRLSKALAVNARTLCLLEKTGVTDALLKHGIKTQGAVLFYNSKPVTRFDFSKVSAPYPFMLVYPQWRTEALLEEHLEMRGIHVERGKEITGIRKIDSSTMRIELNSSEYLESPCILAADGSKSFLRQTFDIPFPGTSYTETWRLFDAEMEQPADKENATAYLAMFDHGAAFCIPVEGATWRIIGNVPNLAEKLPPPLKIKNIVWESDFSIAHRCASAFRHGPVYLAGDAAHIHSPVGGRGMNLGIEDSYVFAALAARSDLGKYDGLRRPVDLKLVRQIERLTEMPRGKCFSSRMFRHFRFMLPLATPFIEQRIGKWAFGLDHPVETA